MQDLTLLFLYNARPDPAFHLSHSGHFYAAIENGDRVSAVMVVKINPIEVFEIFDLGVMPDSKGKGMGTRPLEHAVNIATAQGFKAIDALVFVDNFTMLRLLLSLSFTPVRIDYNRRADGTDLLALKKYIQTSMSQP